MSILADTNILLRRTQPDHPSHTYAVESVAKLLAAGEPVYFTLQNMAEFWNVATMNLNGVRRILTFNTEDFARYDIEVIHPLSLVS